MQTEWVLDRLRQLAPEMNFAPQVITTTGDKSATARRGDGVFVKEIQRALLEGEIQLAVHSLKDLPTLPVAGVSIAAIPERFDPRDALVGSTLAALSPGSKIGTGSPRRAAQLRRLRPDLEVQSIRGNVPTRVEKARSGVVDAVILAAAGLGRLGIEADEIFDAEVILPAPGQGALAVEVRSDDHELFRVVSALDDPTTRASVVAERMVLRELGGGCMLPVAAYGRVEDGALIIDATVVSSSGGREARARGVGDPLRPEEVAQEVAERLVEHGALELL